MACTVAVVAVLRFGAPTIIPAAPSPAPDYAAEVAKLKTADALFDYINKRATIDDIQPDDALPREEQITQVRALVDAKIASLRPAIDAFFRRDGRPAIDALVSLTGFSLVGGPAYNDAAAAEAMLRDLREELREFGDEPDGPDGGSGGGCAPGSDPGSDGEAPWR